MGVNWAQAALGGVATLFAGLLAGSTYVLSNYCSAEFLAVAGITPIEGEAHYAVCAGVTVAWAASAVITTLAGIGGWKYDSSSATANSKRSFYDDRRMLNGTSMVYHQSHLIDTHFDWLVEIHAPTTHPNIRSVARLYHENFTADDGFFHIMSDMPHGLSSIVAAPDAIADALATHEKCITTGDCVSSKFHPTDQLLAKRDDADSGWASYTDWGTNQGYDQDYVDWNYDYLVPHYYAEWIGDQMISKTQDCDSSFMCYAIMPKMCLSLGFSDHRGVDSIIVGEAYLNAYGGVDTECYDG